MSSKIQKDILGRCGVGVPFKNDKPIRFNKIFLGCANGYATSVQMYSKILPPGRSSRKDPMTLDLRSN